MPVKGAEHRSAEAEEDDFIPRSRPWRSSSQKARCESLNRGSDGTACRDRVPGRMIGPPAGTRIWIAAGVTRSPSWIYWPEWNGADGAQREPFFRTCVRISWTAGRFDQVVMVGRRWFVFVREKTRARKIHLAASYQRNSGTDTGPVVHAARRD